MTERHTKLIPQEEAEEISQDLLLSLLPTVLDQMEGVLDLEQGMTNAQLAEYLGCHESTISRATSTALRKMRRRAKSF